MRLRLRRLDSCWAALFLGLLVAGARSVGGDERRGRGPAVSDAGTGPRIGILVQGPLDKGLFRDAECLAWALLRAPVRRAGKVPGAVSVFLTRSYAMLDAALAQATPCVTDKAGRRFCTGAEPLSTNDSALLGPIAAPEGTEVAAWLAQLDTLVVFESPLKSVFRAAHAAGVHSKVLVLNVDWTDPAQVIALALATPGVSLWVKGHATLTHLAPRINPPTARRPAIPLLLVPWSIPDAVVRHRKDLAAEGGGVGVRFLFIAGFGGVLNRRGGDIVLEAFRLLKSQEPAGAAGGGATLDFYSVRHPTAYDHPVSDVLLSTPGLRLHIGTHTRAILRRALLEASVLLYPSRWEGFGLSLLEALHAGVPAIATDGWPMNELVEHGHNGLLVPANITGAFFESPVWEVSPGDLAGAMARFVGDARLRRRTTCAAPGELAARQHRFVMTARRFLLGETAPRVLSMYAGPHPTYLRAETFRSHALRRHGYEVVDAGYGDAWEALVAEGCDFALVAKAPSLEWVRHLKKHAGVPMYMWFWDPIDYGEERRRWFEAIAPLFDAVFLNEKGREAAWAARGIQMHYIEEGVMVESERGPGRRPLTLPTPASGHDVSFQGTVYPYAPDVPRVQVLLELNASNSVRLAVYGPEDMWKTLNLTSLGPSYGAAMPRIHRTSKASLSLSRAQPGVELYRSERLMDGAASGACVVSEVFPGLDLLLPRGAVLTATTPRHYARVVEEVVARPGECQPRRDMAEDAAWRSHTWDDAVGKFLSLIAATPHHHHPQDSTRKNDGQNNDGQTSRPLAQAVAGLQGGGGVGCVRAAGVGCSSMDNYNLAVARLLMGWGHGEAAVPGTPVEAGIYFASAISDCPALRDAWEGMAVALMAQGDIQRGLRSVTTARRLSPRLSTYEGGSRGRRDAELVWEWGLLTGPAAGGAEGVRWAAAAHVARGGAFL